MLVIITGISSGIGFALARHYLEAGNNVIGIGRRNPFRHDRLIFFEKDLSQTTDFSFLEEPVSGTDELLLFNNAGVIGNVQRISEQQHSDIVSTIQVNTIAPMLLCQFVLQHYPLKRPLTIVNISSGAGRRPIPGWAAYCASKAALDMYSQTIYLEEKERNRNIRVYSVAPGVVDTPMQETIRKADPSTFSSLHSFIQLKENDELTDLKTVIGKMQTLLSTPYSGEVIYSLRDIQG